MAAWPRPTENRDEPDSCTTKRPKDVLCKRVSLTGLGGQKQKHLSGHSWGKTFALLECNLVIGVSLDVAQCAEAHRVTVKYTCL